MLLKCCPRAVFSLAISETRTNIFSIFQFTASSLQASKLINTTIKEKHKKPKLYLNSPKDKLLVQKTCLS
jgi:hypothetical protein